MNKTKKVGNIIVPKNRLIQEYELLVTTVLSWTSHNVKFLEESIIPTPDIEYRRLLWEIKSPKGSSSRTIENNIRLALKQSPNIIIDLHRINRPETQCLREIKKQAKLTHGIKRILVITRQNKILHIKG